MNVILQIKFFANADWHQLETDINTFLTTNKLLTENYIDLIYSPTGQSGNNINYSAVLIYRK